ncbi:1-phosphatidylinositol phosphodiesterase precursor [Metamycoplasma cloacale]|nr:1-phosphatidylinositol phosphodiesterase precursor [Metamycoplasma cloacale]
MKRRNKLFLILSPVVGAIPFALISAKILPTDLQDETHELKENVRVDWNDWMSDLNDNKRLADLSLPGTHDSAMFSGKGIVWSFGWPYAWTQSRNFDNQLKMGIRFFDIRVGRTSDLGIRHGAAWSQTQLEPLLDNFVKFLTEHPTEFIIFRIKDENESVNSRDTQWESWLLNVLEKPKYQNFFFNNSQRDKNINPTVKQLRGKMFMFNHFHHLINQDPKWGNVWRNSHLLQQDLYNTKHETKEELVKEFLEEANKNDDGRKYYVNFVSRANSEKPEHTSRALNPKIYEYLVNNPQLYKLGTVVMDFPGISLVGEIIKRNFYYTNGQISRNVLGPLQHSNEREFQDIIDYTNTISVPSSVNGMNVNVYINDQLTQTLNNIQNSIALNNKLVYGQKVSLEFFKLTPKNQFYESRKYNEFTITKYVTWDKTFVNHINQLIVKLQNVKKLYDADNDIYNDIKTLIDNAFITPLTELYDNKIKNDTTIQTFNDLLNKSQIWEKWYGSQGLAIINSYMENLSKIDNIFNQNNLLNSELLAAYTQFKETINNKIKAFNSELPSLTNEAFEEKYSAIINTLNDVATIYNFINSINPYVKPTESFVNSDWEIWNNYNWLIEHAKNEIIIQCSKNIEVINKLFNFELQDVINNSLIEKQIIFFTEQLGQFDNFSRDLNTLHKSSIYNNQWNTLQAEVVKQINNINSYNLKNIKESIKKYELIVNQTNQILANNSFANDNRNYVSNELINKYQQLFEELQNVSQLTDYNYDNHLDLINNIKNLKTEISLEKQRTIIKSQISNLDVPLLFINQYRTDVAEINDIDALNAKFNAIQEDAKLHLNSSYLNGFNNLSDNQYNHYLNLIKVSTTELELQNNAEEVSKLSSEITVSNTINNEYNSLRQSEKFLKIKQEYINDLEEIILDINSYKTKETNHSVLKKYNDKFKTILENAFNDLIVEKTDPNEPPMTNPPSTNENEGENSNNGDSESSNSTTTPPDTTESGSESNEANTETENGETNISPEPGTDTSSNIDTEEKETTSNDGATTDSTETDSQPDTNEGEDNSSSSSSNDTTQPGEPNTETTEPSDNKNSIEEIKQLNNELIQNIEKYISENLAEFPGLINKLNAAMEENKIKFNNENATFDELKLAYDNLLLSLEESKIQYNQFKNNNSGNSMTTHIVLSVVVPVIVFAVLLISLTLYFKNKKKIRLNKPYFLYSCNLFNALIYISSESLISVKEKASLGPCIKCIILVEPNATHWSNNLAYVPPPIASGSSFALCFSLYVSIKIDTNGSSFGIYLAGL